MDLKLLDIDNIEAFEKEAIKLKDKYLNDLKNDELLFEKSASSILSFDQYSTAETIALLLDMLNFAQSNNTIDSYMSQSEFTAFRDCLIKYKSDMHALEIRKYQQFILQAKDNTLNCQTWPPTEELISFKSLLDTTEIPENVLLEAANEFKETYKTVLDKWSRKLNTLLTALKWPSTDIDTKSTEFNDFTKEAIDCISFQFGAASLKNDEPLLPFQTLIGPLRYKFKYHFDSDKPTNRLDKPELYFDYILDSIKVYASFMDNVLSMFFIEALPDVDPLHEFILAWLTVLKPHVTASIPLVSSNPALLNHLVTESVKFDTAMRSEYKLRYRDGQQWITITDFILSNPTVSNTWLGSENDFVRKRYEQILSSAKAFEIELETGDEMDLKPTASARRLVQLLKTSSSHYESLESLELRLKYICNIQLPILKDYAEILVVSVEEFEGMSSRLTRAVHRTGNKNDEISGRKGLTHLCRLFCSAKYMSDYYLEWRDSLFCLKLTTDLDSFLLQGRSTLPSRNESAQLIEKQFSADAQYLFIEDGATVQMTLLDRLCMSSMKLTFRIRKLMTTLLTREARSIVRVLRQYTNEDEEDEGNSLSFSDFKELLSHCKSCLSQSTFFEQMSLLNSAIRREAGTTQSALDEILFSI
ncbi:hypothetical protein CANCADRAFT_30419 [Tortispora caseinolytica NRRL Y-17796]|uniref:Uncharacterized protein n=1 Tax=Tortispora caseinolytica NRRL Y-17796 TaxID=767744 RepID=A0A1E4TK94_9ASCO|nr:hypothetical protein CANCADRAFT_30419 [Tortispora caseinolytica NRRL Y-17796]